jgi:uncharacterized protein (TIRG00374 family)
MIAANPPLRRGFPALFPVLGSVTVLALLLFFLPFQDLVTALREVKPLALAAALGIYLALHLIGVAKWRMLVNASGGGLSFRNAVRCYYSGLFANTFLPSMVGGDVVRAGLGLKLCANPSGLLFGSLVDRTIDIAGLGALAGFGALLVPNALPPQSRLVFQGLLTMFAILGAVVFVIFVSLPVRRFPWKVRRQLAKGRKAITALTRQPGYMIAALAIGMTMQSAFVLLNAWLGRSLGIDVPLVVWFFVWPLAKVSGLVPLTQNGLGVREAALIVLFAPFGVSSLAAMASGLVFAAVIIGGGLLGGLIALVLGLRGGRHEKIENL